MQVVAVVAVEMIGPETPVAAYNARTDSPATAVWEVRIGVNVGPHARISPIDALQQMQQR